MINGGFMLFFNFTQKSSFTHFLLLIWGLNAFGSAQNSFLQRISLKMQHYFNALSCGTRLANTSSLNRMYGKMYHNPFNPVTRSKPSALTVINNIDTLNMQIKNENFQEMEAFTKEKYQKYHAPQFDLGTYKAFKAILPSIIFEIKKYKNKEIKLKTLENSILSILRKERLSYFFWFHMFAQEHIQIENNNIDIQVVQANQKMEVYEPIYFSFIESFIGLKEILNN